MTPLSPRWWASEPTAVLERELVRMRKWADRSGSLGHAAHVADVIESVLAERRGRV